MTGRCRLGVFTAGLLSAALLGNATLEAQQTASSRFRVLIPDFQPMNDEDDDFGKDLADELRDLIDELNTHSAVSEDDIEDALDRFDLDMEDLNCLLARQLAQQSNYEVVMCAGYSGSEEAWQIQNIQFVDSGTGESFVVDPVMSAKDQEEEAAAEIVQAFSLFVEQTRVAVFCGDYAQSQQWENALQNCDRAIELNPASESSRYTRANVLRQTDRFSDALDEVKRLLEGNPFHENALLLGGFLAVNLDDEELAREYYRNYLQLNPANAAVRMNVAYDLAQEGDPLGAMGIIGEGIAADPENIDFHEQFGNFAFAGAEQVRREAEVGGDNGLTPEVRELYQNAVEAYEKVFEAKGEETVVTQLRNVAAAYLQLGNAPEAAAFSERALESHAQSPPLWAIYAEALKQTGQVAEAVAALQSIEEINPDWPNLHLRMANWLIETGDIESAFPALQQAVANGSVPDQAANMIFSHAYSTYVQPTEKNYGRFIEMIQLAKDFDVSAPMLEQYDFWHGYSLYSIGMAIQAPENVETATRSLPLFREALGLFQRGKGYADRTNGIDIQQFVEGTGVYIEIQEAIIKRGQ
ncbi:MAG: tetratricopeptide repeat protein, partial [Gemmatimonadota bacterium]|nr:tetratricopeptide repeat protein [Gemmatimonadota bacterium]